MSIAPALCQSVASPPVVVDWHSAWLPEGAQDDAPRPHVPRRPRVRCAAPECWTGIWGENTPFCGYHWKRLSPGLKHAFSVTPRGSNRDLTHAAIHFLERRKRF